MMINNKLPKDKVRHNQFEKQLTKTSFSIRLLSTVVLTTMLVACGGGSSGGSHSKPSKSKPVSTTKPSVQPSTDLVSNKQEEDNNTSVEADTSNTVPDIQPEPEPEVKPEPEVEASDDVRPNIPSKQHDILSSSEFVAFNRLNSRRDFCGFGGLEVDKSLYNAAKNHTNYLLYMNKYSHNDFQGHFEKQVDQYSGENNPYFTGFNIGSRVKTGQNIGRLAAPVSYPYKMAGENLSFLRFNQDYKDKYSDDAIAINSIDSLLAAPYHMASMLSPYFTQIGISYGQDILKAPIELSNGRQTPGYGSVLEMVLATPRHEYVEPLNTVLTYPCNETQDTQYELTHEYPNPFGNNGRDLQEKPIGQPVYILAHGKLTVSNYKMTDAAGKKIPLKALTQASDPNSLLTESQVILLPLDPLKPSQSYRVSYQVSVDGGAKQSKTIVFHTKAKVD